MPSPPLSTGASRVGRRLVLAVVCGALAVEMSLRSIGSVPGRVSLPSMARRLALAVIPLSVALTLTGSPLAAGAPTVRAQAVASSLASSSASTTKRCAKGRPGTSRLKASDRAFLKRYLRCLLASEGFSAHAKDRIQLGYQAPYGSFAKAMAPTVAGFARAPKSDYNFPYINRKLQRRYDKFSEPFSRQWYTIIGGTSPPPPKVGSFPPLVASAKASMREFLRHAYTNKRNWPRVMAIDVVVQKGTWFHSGKSRNLRYIVLFYFQQ